VENQPGAVAAITSSRLSKVSQKAIDAKDMQMIRLSQASLPNYSAARSKNSVIFTNDQLHELALENPSSLHAVGSLILVQRCRVLGSIRILRNKLHLPLE
jgi:hypothetical protein